jgi:thiamine biosynthesis lipoprotein
MSIRFQFKALGSNNEIQLDGLSRAQAEDAARAAIDETRRIEEKYSRYRGASFLSQINREASVGPVEVDAETAVLLDTAAELYALSTGRFDITSGVLRRAWDFKRGVLPSQQQIDQLLELVGWQKLEWCRPNLRFLTPGMELDFGGIGKEYAVDRAAELLLAQGVRSGFVNFGGDVRVLGPKPNGEPWLLGIQHPRMPGRSLGVVKAFEQALATSGDYQRFFEVEGTRYCHILDAKSGWPVSELQSVSVGAPSCLRAGALASICMLLGERQGLQLLEQERVSYIVITKKGEVRAQADVIWGA